MCSFIQPLLTASNMSGPVLGTCGQLLGTDSRDNTWGNNEKDDRVLGNIIYSNLSEKGITPKPLTDKMEEQGINLREILYNDLPWLLDWWT